MPIKFSDPKEWFFFELERAEKAQILEPNAMVLATFGLDGFPNIRTVLYKGWRDSGLSFFTNYNSPKGLELRMNPRACLNFFWAALGLQIRIQGVIHQLSRSESEAYFASRPRLSQIGAWASEQSAALSSYQDLEKEVESVEKKYHGVDVPCPPYWGGFVLTPIRYEFWLAQEGRLHERYLFSRSSIDDLLWSQSILSP